MACLTLDLRGKCLNLLAGWDRDTVLYITIYDVASDSTKTVRNITGYSYDLNIKASKSTAPILTVAGVIPTGTDGVVSFIIPKADVEADLTVGTSYYYDITETNTTSLEQTYLSGQITFDYV